MKTIVAVDNNWGIGKNGKLLVNLPEDLKYFKEKTLGKVVVMGRATFESLPGKSPLKGRINIVLSRNPDFNPDCIICRTIDEVFNVLESYDTEDVFIIGGQEIYKQFFPYCSEYLVTRINNVFNADKHFENLDVREDMELVWKSETHIENGIEYQFTEYRRKLFERRTDAGV
ncbi:MAG: dihydrofolate reductase [Eubacteriales bacterium]|nr:dihydrofolate reductase [Eubacteriales bacterium]